MEKQQLEIMLSMEKSYSKFSIKSHPKRRIIADCLNKLTDDERMSDDIFALTMNIFDNFLWKYSSTILNDDRFLQLIALCCYNLAKKLRTNVLINNENEQISLIFSHENYSDEEIFDTEQLITDTLDWDLAFYVPQDYIQLLFENFLSFDNRNQIYFHVQILSKIAICELNTLTIRPSLLACACIKAAIKGLSFKNLHQIDEVLFKLIHCQQSELLHTQYMIEQYFQSCVQSITPSPRRRCLVPIDTSPQQRTKVK